MNRCFVVLGLALAVCGTAVAGQAAQKDAPVPIRTVPGNAGAYMPPLVQSPPAVQATFRVESVTPKLTRVHVATNGHPHGTFESTGFTVTMDTSGTSIVASGPVDVITDRGTFTVSGLTVRVGTDGSFSIAHSSVTSQTNK